MSTSTAFPGTMATAAAPSGFSGGGTGTVDWTNPNYAKATDTTYATNATGAALGYVLKASDFGFSLSGATINGISVADIQHDSSASHYDGIYVQLQKGGGFVGTAKLDTTHHATDATITFGTSSDLWGETWSGSDFDSSFGCGLQVSGGGSLTVSVDSLAITVTYTGGGGLPAAPTGLAAAWPGTSGSTSVDLSWTQGVGGTITDNKVQQSTDGSTWSTTDLGSAVTSHTVTGLSTGTLYYFRVAASNSFGDSSYSSLLPAYTDPTTTLTAALVPVSDATTTGWTKAGGGATYTATLTDASDMTYAVPPASLMQPLALTLTAVPSNVIAVVGATATLRAKSTSGADLSCPIFEVRNSGGSTNIMGFALFSNVTTSFANCVAAGELPNSGPQDQTAWSGAMLYIFPQGTDQVLELAEASVTISYLAARIPVTSTQVVPVEWTLTRAAEPVLPIESGRLLAAAPALPLEPKLGLAEASAVLPLESTSSIDPATIVLPIEALGMPSSSPVLPIEFGQTVVPVSLTVDLPIETNLAVALTLDAPVEWTGVTLIEVVRPFPVESLGSRAATRVLPLDPHLAVGAVTAQLPLEWKGTGVAISELLVLPLESLGSVAAFGARLPIEAKQDRASAPALPLEPNTSAAETLVVPLETIASLGETHPLPFETIGSIGDTNRLPIETPADVALVAELPIAAQLDVANSDVPLPLDWRGAFAAPTVLALEWNGKGLAVFWLFPIGWLAPIRTAPTVPIESLAGLVGPGPDLPIESLATFAAAPSQPLEWTGAASTVVLAVPLPIEILTDRASTPVIPLAFIAEVRAAALFPLEHLADAPSRPVLPIEAALQLASAPALPIATHLDVPGAITLLAIEWNLDVESLPELPLEWRGELPPDVSGGVFVFGPRGTVWRLPARGDVFQLPRRGCVFQLG